MISLNIKSLKTLEKLNFDYDLQYNLIYLHETKVLIKMKTTNNVVNFIK